MQASSLSLPASSISNSNFKKWNLQIIQNKQENQNIQNSIHKQL